MPAPTILAPVQIEDDVLRWANARLMAQDNNFGFDAAQGSNSGGNAGLPSTPACPLASLSDPRLAEGQVCVVCGVCARVCESVCQSLLPCR